MDAYVALKFMIWLQLMLTGALAGISAGFAFIFKSLGLW